MSAKLERETRLRIVLSAGAVALVALLAMSYPASAQGTATSPVFTRDVAPILQEKCQACHRPGYIAPMPLMTYEDARPWARSIKARVLARQMPTWHIDKRVGIQQFKNDRSPDRHADRHDRAVGQCRGAPR